MPAFAPQKSLSDNRSMSKSLFRETALQNLSSPEQLDQVVRITRGRAWIVLLILGLVIAATLVWSIVGSLPSTVSGQGLIIRRGGTYSIFSAAGGIITEFNDVKDGQIVHKGQVIGRVAQPLLVIQRDAARTELLQLRTEQASISAEIGTERLARTRSLMQQAEGQRALIRSREQLLKQLREDGAHRQEAGEKVTRQHQEETQQQAMRVENELVAARNALQDLDLQTVAMRGRFDERARQISSQILTAQHKLDALSAQLELGEKLVSPYDGLVIEVLASKGDTIAPNQAVLSVESAQRTLEAIIYIPPRSEAAAIRPGMAVQLSPTTARKERYGYLVGKVRSVSQYPSTERGMLAVVDNLGLVRELARDGPPVAVTVDLTPDATTRSGYQWSSAAARELDLRSGTLASGVFTIETQRPISLLIPLLKQTGGL